MEKITDTTYPTLRSRRLELTPIAQGDRGALLELLSLEPVRRYLLDGNVPEAEWVASLVVDSDRGFERGGLGLWAARRPREPRLAGLVGFREFYEPPVEELLYALHPDFWGQGLATEMAAAAIDHAFGATSRQLVRASTDLPNTASLEVMRRLGMQETGREPASADGRWDQVHCAIERGAWQLGSSPSGGR